MHFSSALVAAHFLLALHPKLPGRDPATGIMPPVLFGKHSPSSLAQKN
jgi:hypothetical protein